MRRRRARVALVAALALLFIGSSTAVLAQTSDGGTPLGGYKLDARAQAINVLHDSPTFPSPTHPDFDGSVPAAQSTTDTGPIGHGLAAIFWPGPLGGNFGSALNQINQVCAPVLPVPGLPPVCVPTPQQLKDHSSQFNDPIRAETFYPQAPQNADNGSIPGVTMKSQITDNGKKVESFGALDGFGSAGVGIAASLTAKTTNTLTDTTGTSEATSEADNLVLGGGMVTIGRVFSTAKITTDGSKATADAHTTIDGLKIAGQGATVDDQGVHIAGQSNPLHKQINQAVAQALAKSGLTIKLVQNENSIDGATGSVTAGALVIQYEDDKDQLVKGGIQNSFTISLGGATASVDSSQGSNSDLGEAPAEAAPTDTGGDNTAVAGLEIPPAGLGSVATPPSALPRSTRRASVSQPFRPILNSFGLAWGLVLFAVIAALGLGFGLRRVTDDVFAEAPAAAACPLEEPKR
ncbi:MAG: hypothetical protein JOZ68_04120 [Acidimicrobiia bacterium]|nr:hypothetical protein [Acidimicrobiia bacterium]MBV9040160.1 hypothetical protein [Acidimicrobiia bacterium]